MQHEPPTKDADNINVQMDVLKSNANLHVQKLGENEISIVGIDNSEQYEFVVEIHLRYIDLSDHLDDTIDFIYKLFDEQKLELHKNSEDGQFHIDHIITIKFKSSLSDLVIYFRNIFSLPIVLASHKDEIKGTSTLGLMTLFSMFTIFFLANNVDVYFDLFSPCLKVQHI